MQRQTDKSRAVKGCSEGGWEAGGGYGRWGWDGRAVGEGRRMKGGGGRIDNGEVWFIHIAVLARTCLEATINFDLPRLSGLVNLHQARPGPPGSSHDATKTCGDSSGPPDGTAE